MIELLLACAPLIDPVTMGSIIKQESGGVPFVINDNTGKKVYKFNNKQDAVLKATELISVGNSIDLGLAQINSKNLARLGLSVEQVLDPCKNISAGAKILRENYEKTNSLPAALSMYNTGKSNSSIGQKYAAGVYKQAGVVVPAIPGGKMPKLPSLAAGEGVGVVDMDIKKVAVAAPLQPGAGGGGRQEKAAGAAAQAGFGARWE